jgi:peroxiredoxin Q/BCP
MKRLFAWLAPSLNAPKVGEAAPDFELAGHEGRLRSSREFRGKWLVLYFFPRADTPG